jgi:hypothetical protein
VTESGETNRKLDLIIALMRIGFSDQIQRRGRILFDDPTSVEILGHCDDWTPAGTLKSAVAQATKQSEPTIKRRIADLVSLGALARRGAGGSVSYCSTGLFDV